MTLAGNLYAHPSIPFLPPENQEPTAHQESPPADPIPADSESPPGVQESPHAHKESPLVDEVPTTLF